MGAHSGVQAETPPESDCCRKVVRTKLPSFELEHLTGEEFGAARRVRVVRQPPLDYPLR